MLGADSGHLALLTKDGGIDHLAVILSTVVPSGAPLGHCQDVPQVIRVVRVFSLTGYLKWKKWKRFKYIYTAL